MTTRTYTPLPPPDVEVSVTTSTQTPVISIPTLTPVAVGPCYQIVEVLESTGATNSNALITLPAILKSNGDGDYTVSTPGDVTWKANNGTELTTSFTATTYTAAQVVALFNATTNLAGAVCEVVEGTTSSDVRFQLRTTEAGQFKSLSITGGNTTVLGELGLPAVSTQVYQVNGYSSYDMTSLPVDTSNYYDAGRDNMDELTFDADDIVVAYDDGSGTLTTISSDSTVERWGTGDITIEEDGDYDNYSPIVKIPTSATPADVEVLDAAGVAATVTAGSAPGSISAGEWLEISVAGSQYHRVVFGASEVIAGIVSKINEHFPFTVASDSAGSLKLDDASGNKGSESCILLNPNSTADVGFTFGTAGGNPERTIGTWYPVLADDAFYADGVFMGYVSEVLSGTGEFKLDREWSQATFAGTHTFYFISRNLTAAWIASAAPTPDLYVDADGNIIVKHRILKTTAGVPSSQTLSSPAGGLVDNGSALIYVGYTALRLDVSPSAETPGLIDFDDTDDITNEIGPISSANPLALASYMTKINAPGLTTYALGIDETSSDAVYGTSTAYSEAADYLESEEVYTIVPLTQDRTILAVLQTHVEAMSAVAAKKERVLFGTIDRPTRAPDTIVSSGTEGNDTGVTNELNTGVAGLSALLLANGIDPGSIAVEDDVYIDIEQDAKNYNITGSVSGPIVTVNVTFAAGENTDDFYTTDNLPSSLINETWSLNIRGAALVDGSGDPDKTAIAQALNDIAYGFSSSRVVIGHPGNVVMTLSGINTIVPSFYAAAVEAGKVASMPPQQGHTNTTATGILGVQGASDYFSETQMNIAAGGGIWWWYQRTPNEAVTCRHQVTTDLTTITTREFSIQKTLDFIAKIVRANFRPLLGRYNINEDLLSLMSAIMNGVCKYLVEEIKCVNECEFSSFETDTANPDTLDVNLDVVLQYPFNKLRVTIRI